MITEKQKLKKERDDYNGPQLNILNRAHYNNISNINFKYYILSAI